MKTTKIEQSTVNISLEEYERLKDRAELKNLKNIIEKQQTAIKEKDKFIQNILNAEFVVVRREFFTNNPYQYIRKECKTPLWIRKIFY